MGRTNHSGWAAAAAALALLAAAAPLGASQDAPASAGIDESDRKTSLITFYGHVFDATRYNPMPMNVEFPWGEEDFSAGYGDTCGVDALDPLNGKLQEISNELPVGPTVQGSCETEELNEVWFYSTAGFVDVKDSNDFSYENIHNERGLTKDTYLDTTQDITATVFMSADGHGWSAAFCNLAGTKPHDIPEPMGCWNWDPGVLKGWTLRARLYVGVLGEYGGEANTQPDVLTAYADGALEVIAEGTSAPQDVVSIEAAGQPTVWRFDIDLGKARTAVIPKEKSYLWSVEWWSDVGGNKVILPPNWNLNSGELYPNAITIPVRNAFDVESLIPQFVHEKLVLHGILNTPWGSYDVDQKSVALTVNDASGGPVQPMRIVKLADYSVAHGGHYKPVNVTYVWDYKADALEAGKYSATISATNFQGSASAACTGYFEVLDRGQPGPIAVGQCAVATLTEEQRRRLDEGVAGAPGGDADGAPAARLPPILGGAESGPPLHVASSATAPVPAASAIAPAAAIAIASLVLAIARRWSR